MPQIGGLQKTTLIDYPGKIACTVFLTGCNFRCPWCYSPELVLPEKIKLQPKFLKKDFFDFLKEKKGLLEGVVICGSEPTINKDLPEFAKRIKKSGYLIKLDTNGSKPEVLKKLIGEKLVNYIAMDIKAPLDLNFKFSTANFQSNSKCQISKYQKAAGVKVNLRDIKKSVEIIKGSGIDYEFRTTVVPGIHTKDDILQIAREISPAKKFYLQSFLPQKTILSELEKIKPYPEEFLLEIQRAVSPFFEVCQVRGA